MNNIVNSVGGGVTAAGMQVPAGIETKHAEHLIASQPLANQCTLHVKFLGHVP